MSKYKDRDSTKAQSSWRCWLIYAGTLVIGGEDSIHHFRFTGSSKVCQYWRHPLFSCHTWQKRYSKSVCYESWKHKKLNVEKMTLVEEDQHWKTAKNSQWIILYSSNTRNLLFYTFKIGFPSNSLCCLRLSHTIVLFSLLWKALGMILSPLKNTPPFWTPRPAPGPWSASFEWRFATSHQL